MPVPNLHRRLWTHGINTHTQGDRSQIPAHLHPLHGHPRGFLLTDAKAQATRGCSADVGEATSGRLVQSPTQSLVRRRQS